MPEPKITASETAPPGEDLRALAKSIFNLFPNWDIRLHGEVDSTNAEGRRLAEKMGGEAWKRLILTEYQAIGRGRQGRTWEAAPGTSLLATLCFPQAQFKARQSLLPLAAACWLMEGFDRFALKDVRVKWPNDILVAGRKVSGILCESTRHAFLIGIGVNITQGSDELPVREAHLPQPTSVRQEMGKGYAGWFASSLTLLGSLLENVEHQRGEEWILQDYRQRCISLGESVAFKDYERGSLVGTAQDFDESGALIVHVEGVGTRRVTTPIE